MLGWAAAQETTNEGDLQSVIVDLRQGAPNYDDMDAPLRLAVREQAPQVQQFLHQLGNVVDIRFEETDQGVDIYLVQHERGRTIWQFARSPSGRIGVLWFNAF